VSESSGLGEESQAVLAFIHASQTGVLRDAIAALEASSPDDLPAVVHSIRGSLGSYRLHDAHAHVADLSRLIADQSTSPASADAARLGTVEALRALQVAAEDRSVISHG